MKFMSSKAQAQGRHIFRSLEVENLRSNQLLEAIFFVFIYKQKKTIIVVVFGNYLEFLVTLNFTFRPDSGDKKINCEDQI